MTARSAAQADLKRKGKSAPDPSFGRLHISQWLETWRTPSVGWPFYPLADRVRRTLAALLDAADFAPVRTPAHNAEVAQGVKLLCYAGQAQGPVALLVPAPIKAATIWDLLPRASAVRRLLQAGFRVYLIEWDPPGAKEVGFGLAQYADELIAACCDTIRKETGAHRVVLLGHSLGGTLAALYAALHPDRVSALVLFGAPLHFGPNSGALGRLAGMIPPGEYLPAMEGNIPGTVIDSLSLIISPAAFVWSRWLDLAASLRNKDALETHLAVERWTLQEMPMARRLFDDVVQRLLRDNSFMRGVLEINGVSAAPGNVTAPVLAVVDPRCPIAPPQSVQPFLDAVATDDVQMLTYVGDRGVSLQHVGMLVGRNAHRQLWPRIVAWLAVRAMPSTMSHGSS